VSYTRWTECSCCRRVTEVCTGKWEERAVDLTTNQENVLSLVGLILGLAIIVAAIRYIWTGGKKK